MTEVLATCSDSDNIARDGRKILGARNAYNVASGKVPACRGTGEAAHDRHPDMDARKARMVASTAQEDPEKDMPAFAGMSVGGWKRFTCRN
jgi:hypothetical protein